MEEARDRIVSLSTASGAAEERMLGADLVSEMVARKDRGAGIKQIARELGVDRKTVRRWLKLGAWQPRQVQRRARQLDRFAPFIERRAPEVGFNGAVLYRELQGLGFTGGIVQVQRWLRPQRERRKWSELATVRFETGPGEQAQVDYGQLKVWIGEQLEKVHLFVFTLGYSRRLYARGYHHERLTTLLDGHERVPLVRRRDAKLSLRQPAQPGAGPPRAQSVVASAVRGFSPLLRLYAARLSALSGAHQGQGRERRQIRQAQCPGGPAFHFVGGSQQLARTLERRGRRPADPRHHP